MALLFSFDRWRTNCTGRHTSPLATLQLIERNKIAIPLQAGVLVIFTATDTRSSNLERTPQRTSRDLYCAEIELRTLVGYSRLA